MAGEYILDLEQVKAVTGAKTDEEAVAQVLAVQELIEGYLGVTLIKADFADEKITVPYALSNIIRPAKSPVNSVSKIGLLQADGTYKAYTGQYTFSRDCVQFLTSYSDRVPARVIPGKVGAVKMTYNAGLYDDYTQAPALLAAAAKGLLGWLFADPHALDGYQSEHLSDYSYTKGATVRGIPAAVAGILDGVRL